jgi:cytochrome c oxidase subunit 2
MLRILFSIGGVVLALCLVLLIYSAIAFRHRPGDAEDGPPMEGGPRLETAWTLVPLAIVLYLAFQGAVMLRDINRVPPAAELEVKVTAFQWGWSFEYPQYGITSTEVRLPVDRPVLFKLTSTDVVHSFWVPEFRVKQDAVPGMVTALRVTPNRVGSYRVLCAEMCGVAHALMIAPVMVMEPAEFERWLEQQRR